MDPEIRRRLIHTPHIDLIHSTQSKRLAAYHQAAGYAFERGMLLMLYHMSGDVVTHLVLTESDLLLRNVGAGISHRVAWRDITLFEPDYKPPRHWTINA